MLKSSTKRISVIGYCRVSTREQAVEGVSLAAQEANIRAYAERAGLDLVGFERDEGVSAFQPLASRPGGSRILEAIDNGEVQAVVALKLDRIFRNAIDCLSVTASWDKEGIALHLIDHGGMSLDTRSPMGRFFLTMMAGFAEMERGLIAERTRTALQFKKSRGQVYNHVPFGYERMGDELVPNLAEQEVIARIVKLRREGNTLRAICAVLEAAGNETKRGGRWQACSVDRILKRAG